MTKKKALNLLYTAAPNIDVELARQSDPFQQWLQKVDRRRFKLRGIHFQSVDTRPDGKVLFVKFVCDCVRKNGEKIHGITFARGGAVAILLVLNCKGKKYAVLTKQARLPTGKYQFVEVPAGMLDGSGDFAGVAAREIEEELGIKINASELIDLTEMAGQKSGFFLSPGVCEETVRLFYKELDVTPAEMKAMEGRLGGLAEEHEVITLAIEPLEKLWRVPDAKTMLAYLLYQKLIAAPA
ncbi:MAG: NUDIX domain-containing protein [Candidatus Obscuribacterales bacterium]|nr:NUDIX domain-containing protein [Candidatus Obscuribacterales bacterium]